MNPLSRIFIVLTLAMAPAWSGEAPDAATDQQASAPPAKTLLSYKFVPQVHWPGNVDREAMIYVRVVVDAEGRVVDATVADHSFGEQRFVDTALAAAKQFLFNPATVDGKPVETAAILPLGFKAGRNFNTRKSEWVTGISTEFRRELRKVEKLLKDRDFDGAHFHAEWMLQEKVRFTYEYAVLKAQLAQTLALVGRDLEALRAAEEATKQTVSSFRDFSPRQQVPPNSPDNYMLPEKVVTSLLDLRIQLAARNGLPIEALQAYYELAGLVKMAPADPRPALAEQLIARLESDEPLAIRARIRAKAWSTTPYRHRFAVAQVDGEIHAVKMSCGRDELSSPYSPGEEWKKPAEWQGCPFTVTIDGEPGTGFTFILIAD